VNQHPRNGSVRLREALVRGLVQQNLAQLGRVVPEPESGALRVAIPRRRASAEDVSSGTRSRVPLRRRLGLKAGFLALAIGYLSVFGTSAFRQVVPGPATPPASSAQQYDGELLHELDKATSSPDGLPISLAQMFQLRVRRVVIDPGHGGKDPGCKAPSGLEEKTVTLNIARALAPILERRIGAEVILTRDRDEYVALEERAEHANRLEADLFISIHLNWFPNGKIQRVETYFVGLSNDKESLELAARENAGGDLPLSEFEVVLRRMAQTLKVQESRRLADLVQASLFGGQHKKNSSLKDHGVGRAPFVVLMGTKMPSILAEVSFLSEPEEAERLESPQYLTGIADELADGIVHYLTSGDTTAEALPHAR
jgi:N-acetylmuramoyl-L-alanine amidase